MAAMLIAVSTSVNKEMWVKLKCVGQTPASAAAAARHPGPRPGRCGPLTAAGRSGRGRRDGPKRGGKKGAHTARFNDGGFRVTTEAKLRPLARFGCSMVSRLISAFIEASSRLMRTCY